MLTVKNLQKTTSHGTIINNVNLVLHESEIFALVGEPQSGKSLLSHLILNLATKSKGSVKVKSNKTLGAFLQNAPLLPHDTVKTVIKDYYHLNKYSYNDHKAKNILALFNLRASLNKRIEQLTASECDRLKIALPLMIRTNILVLDAPFTNLTINESRDLRVLLKKISNELKTAILVTVRKISEIEEICDTIGIIDNGVIIAIKSYNEMIAKEMDHAKLAITVAEPNYGAKLIENKFQITSKVAGDKIIVNTKPENVQTFVDFLKDHNVTVLGASRAFRSLEFQYLEIIKNHRNYY